MMTSNKKNHTYHILIGGASLEECEPARAIRDLITANHTLTWNPFESEPEENTICFLTSRSYVNPDGGWRLLLASRGGIPRDDHVLAVKGEWILRFSPGRCVVVRPTQFWTLWRDAQFELVDPNLSGARLRIAASPEEAARAMFEIEGDEVFVEAFREYFASLPKEEFDKIAGLISAGVGLPRNVRVQVRSIPFADAMSMVEQWPDKGWREAGARGSATLR